MKYRGKNVLASILIIIGILNICYLFFGLWLGWGFYFGLKVITGFGIILIADGIIKILRKSKRKSFVESGLDLIIVFAFVFSIICEAFIISGFIHDNNIKTENVIVLGAGLKNHKPSLELRNRLDKCIEYLKDHKEVKKVVLSGGRGSDEVTTEADVMYNYLVNRGIDSGLLIKEELSTSTYENFKFSRESMRKNGLDINKKTAVITNCYHVFRAKMIAKSLRIDAVGIPAKTPLYIIPNHHVREYFAIVKTIVFDIFQDRMNFAFRIYKKKIERFLL